MLLKLLLIFFTVSSLSAGQIIYLNGTSSAGKTTLAKALQNHFKEPYLLVGIDVLIEMMPAKINNWQGGHAELGFSWKQSKDEEGHQLKILQMGPFAAKMPNGLRAIAKALADCGFNLIIDDVASDANAAKEWHEALKGQKVLWVGLTAPLEVIEKREKERGDRQLGQARAVYNEVHNGFKYDLYYDTSTKSMPEMVQAIEEACAAKAAAKS